MSSGFRAPTGYELRQEFQQTVEEELGQPLDWSRGSPLGALAAAAASTGGTVAEAAQAAFDQRRLQNATGPDLDDLAYLTGTERQEATASTVRLALTASSSTAIPEGVQVEGPNGFTWESNEDGSAQPGGGTPVTFECQTLGPVTVSPGATWEIITPVGGWEGATNSSAATPGLARDSDQDLLDRRNREFHLDTERTEGSLRANVGDLGFIDRVVVEQNDTDSPKTVGSLLLNPRSVGVVIYPPTSTLTGAEQQTLAETIFGSISEGIEPLGDFVRVITAQDGSSRGVAWSDAGTQTVNVSMSPTFDSGANESRIKSDLEDAAEAYFNGLQIGDDVKYLGLIGRLADIDNFDQIDSLNLTVDGGSSNVTIPPVDAAIPSISVT